MGTRPDTRPRPARSGEARRADGGSVPVPAAPVMPEPSAASVPVKWWQRTPSDRLFYTLVLAGVLIWIVLVFALTWMGVLTW